ncbi:DEAD-box ATP-dependent RNA helicase 40-like [Phoenix dactylifera]|uniref:DEAD-box ATP-dependent RNA helicase 40-like n=1 Tax=Phoenix dactylifera TaxID=42345 RepID=A0A8B8ZZX0_PHODC|nr:DEAD-box ATP-dependent RNA helicase 40-like [Phoenix dactylifera]
MATTEAAPASLGPRFAPEDPALPKPWKGLIDGSTGLLYYWNPETNVTQYERPATSAPPLPPGPPPSASLPNLAPIPIARTVPPNGTVQQQPRQQLVQQAGQQVQQQQPSQQVFQQEGQLTQQQQKLSQQLPLQQSGQQMTLQQSGQQVALQQTQQLPYQQPQQVSNQQFTQQRTPRHFSHMQLQQMPYQQISYLQGQLMPRPEGQQQQGLQFASYQQGQQSQGPQVSYQQGQQPQGPQIPHQQQTQESQMMLQQQPQGSQVPHSQGLQIAAQLLQHTQGPPIAQQQGQQSQGSHIGNQLEQKKQGQQVGLPGVEEATRQEGKQAGLSLPQVQQSSLISGDHHLPSSLPQVNISPVGSHSIQPQQQFGGASPVSAQQNSSLQLQPVGIDTSYRQQQTSGTTVPNQLGHPMVCPPMGLHMGYDDDQHERGRTEFYSSRRMEEPMMLPQQPLARSQQDMRMSHQFIPPGHSGGLNMLPQHPLPNMYSHAAFPNPAALRPPLGMFGSSDFQISLQLMHIAGTTRLLQW